MLSFHCLVKQGLFTSTLQKRKWGLGERLPQCVGAAWLLNHDLLTDCLFGASSGSQPPGAITLHPSVTLYPGSWAQPGSFACCPGFYLCKLPTAFLPCYRVAVPTKPTFGCPSSPGRTGGWVLRVTTPRSGQWGSGEGIFHPCDVISQVDGTHSGLQKCLSESETEDSVQHPWHLEPTLWKSTPPPEPCPRGATELCLQPGSSCGREVGQGLEEGAGAMVKPQLGRMVRRGGLAACYPEEDSRGPAHSFIHSLHRSTQFPE